MRYTLTALLSAGALVFGASACGSSDNNSGDSGSTTTAAASTTPAAASGGDAKATAQAVIDKGKQVPEWNVPGATPFDMTKIKGKVIFNIPVTSAVPYVVSVDQAAAQVAKKYGAKWVEYTNQGTPTQWTAGINQAIAQHASVIILAQGIAVT